MLQNKLTKQFVGKTLPKMVSQVENTHALTIPIVLSIMNSSVQQQLH